MTTALLLSFFILQVNQTNNPIIQTMFTADPAPMVYNDTLFTYSTQMVWFLLI